MITPRFSLSQDAESLTLTIRAPYCSLRELDVSVEDNAFVFFCRPYYLRLNLPGSILENDRTRSKFNSDEGEFTFTYDKENPGEHFPDLEFVTKFLCSKVEVEEGGRTIEVLATEEESTVEESCATETNEGYGFAMRGGYNINNLDSEFGDVFKINPHVIKLNERASLRIKDETEKFDPEHYTADFVDDEEIKNICAFDCPWRSIEIPEINFTSKELDFLKDLPNVHYDLNPDQISHCRNSLLEILYAYCYDRRTTFFEGTCESGWTISTVSGSLCWFDGFTGVKPAMIAAYRRSLIFPLYRSFALCERVFEDLKTLLALGEKFLIRCLIEIYHIFLGGDSGRFILNNLFVKDYIIYVMKWNKEQWADVVKDVMRMEIEKQELGLGLFEIEESINRCDNLTNGFANLNLADNCDSDDCTTDSSDSSNSDDSSDSYSIGTDGTESDDVLSDLSSISRTT